MSNLMHSGRLQHSRHADVMIKNGLRLVGDVFVSRFVEYEQPIQIATGAFVASRIGAYSYTSLGARVHNTTIGRYCSIADNLTTAPGDRPTDHISTSPASFGGTFDWFCPSTFPPSEDGPQSVSIGNDVWVGTDVLILGGITIGDGAIIAARSVVTRDVAPYTIVGGVPARIIRERFDRPTIERLIKLSIWDFNLPRLFAMTGIPIHLSLTPSILDALERAIAEKVVHPMPTVTRRLSPTEQGQWRLEAISPKELALSKAIADQS